MIEQYMALALQPTMRGCRTRADVTTNIRHISELIDAAVWLSAIDLPVRLICIPEGCLQGFTDEVFDWDHEKYVDELALDLPGEETDALGRKAKQHNAFVIAQAKVKHPEFPKKFFRVGTAWRPQFSEDRPTQARAPAPIGRRSDVQTRSDGPEGRG